MALDFSGKRVVVSGGSRGIGRATALAFAAARRERVDLRPRRGRAARSRGRAEAHGGKVHAAACDLADGARRSRAISPRRGAALGGIDVLVNNASGFGSSDDEAGWAKSIEVDLMASVRACARRAAALIGGAAAGGAAIVSYQLDRRRAGARAHRALRRGQGGAEQYTASQGATLAAKKIRVNSVAPGSIEFPGGVMGPAQRDDRRLYDDTLRAIPLGRWACPRRSRAWCCSSPATWRAGSPARPSRWMAGSFCSAEEEGRKEAVLFWKKEPKNFYPLRR